MRHTYPEILELAACPDRPDEYNCEHGVGHPWPEDRYAEEPDLHTCCHELEHCPSKWGRRNWERRERSRRIRAAGMLHADGLSLSQSATTLGVPEAEARRLIAIAKTMPENETPEEHILEWALRRTDRRALIHTLAGLHYSYGESAPHPMEGASRGSWDDIEDARIEGLLTAQEFEEIRVAVAAREGVEP